MNSGSFKELKIAKFISALFTIFIQNIVQMKTFVAFDSVYVAVAHFYMLSNDHSIGRQASTDPYILSKF